jgi:hypothetical protein
MVGFLKMPSKRSKFQIRTVSPDGKPDRIVAGVWRFDVSDTPLPSVGFGGMTTFYILFGTGDSMVIDYDKHRLLRQNVHEDMHKPMHKSFDRMEYIVTDTED